ncbi:hypothetical protein M3184_20380 [Metabacillus litoralis]|uniref:Transposase n=1 Tax=Metabacillus rhizolycopersici TaxID=2875709 RepID=A0ABS7UZQ7_9BACI|nr:hypothetical protein [Metabacillus rhizolycopersici]MBZ5753818.1 hypothetical protein [Metabacillus rhizolycopersici]MCM3654136.1 hypothetical protein [Metabacillus litoralis]
MIKSISFHSFRRHYSLDVVLFNLAIMLSNLANTSRKNENNREILTFPLLF